MEIQISPRQLRAGAFSSWVTLAKLEDLWLFGEKSCESFSVLFRGLLFSSFLDLGFSSDEATNENVCGSPRFRKFNIWKDWIQTLFLKAECIQESVCTTWSWTFVAVGRLTQMMRTHKWHWGIPLSCPQFLPASAGLLSQRTKMTTSLNQFLLWKVVPWHSPWWVHLHPIFSGNKFETKGDETFNFEQELTSNTIWNAHLHVFWKVPLIASWKNMSELWWNFMRRVS